MALGRRPPHQRRLPLPVLVGVGVGPRIEEQLDNLDVARAGCRHQGRLALRQGAVGVGAGVEQGLDHAGTPRHGRERQRPDAVAVAGVGDGARREEQPGRLDVAGVGGPVERGGAVGLGRVDIGPGIDEGAHARRVTGLDRIDERHVRGSGENRRRGRQQRCEGEGEQQSDPSHAVVSRDVLVHAAAEVSRGRRCPALPAGRIVAGTRSDWSDPESGSPSAAPIPSLATPTPRPALQDSSPPHNEGTVTRPRCG